MALAGGGQSRETESVNDPVETAIRVIVDLLVRRQFSAVEAITRGVRLPAAEIEAAVTSYGRTFVAPGVGWWQAVTVTPVHTEPGTFHAAVPLWTVEEGRSDLTLELRLREVSEGVFYPEVLNIHVL
jgi:hypothetical protein